MTLALRDFAKVLPVICGPDTTLSPEGWTQDNPLYGHCAVVSALAQDIFGGGLLRGSLEDTPYASMRSHYVNRFDGEVHDFTAGQFTEGYPAMELEERTREYLLSNPNTLARYKELAFRFAATQDGNALFDDPVYKACFLAAADSRCTKKKFGCVAMIDGDIVAAAANDTNPLLAYLCEGGCIRDRIASRTESIIGACDHAEERVLDQMIDEGLDLSRAVLYIAGFDPGWVPYIKNEAEHTCLRCANQMQRRHVGGIYVPVADHWEPVDPDEAVGQAVRYALGEKRV